MEVSVNVETIRFYQRKGLITRTGAAARRHSSLRIR